MPKKTIQRFLPDPEVIRQHKSLRMLGPWMQRANLWHLNRRSASGALALGMVVAWIPIPFQMMVAALFAILVGVNLPLAVVTVWISNPVTMPVMFYAAYLCGTWAMDWPRTGFHFELSWHWLAESFHAFGPPFLLGCAILGLASAGFTYLVINSLWRYSILFSWKKRRESRIGRARP